MTLVEVLLALGILSAVLALLLSAFTGAERARTALAQRSRQLRGILLAQDRIAQEVAGAFSSNSAGACRLTGREDRFGAVRASTLAFTAFAALRSQGGAPATGLLKVRYFPRQMEDGRLLELWREEAPAPLIENRFPVREARIAASLSAFRVEFWDGSAWVTEWPRPGTDPAAAPRRIAVILADEGERQYRREIALPLAGQEGALPLSGRRPGIP